MDKENNHNLTLIFLAELRGRPYGSKLFAKGTSRRQKLSPKRDKLTSLLAKMNDLTEFIFHSNTQKFLSYVSGVFMARCHTLYIVF